MNRYVERIMSSQLKEAAASFPIVVLTGPRQTGKSTLLQKIFPNSSYVTFDDLMVRAGAVNDPAMFVENLDLPVILDEIQYVPNLLPYIKMAVDKNRRENGVYILTGSQIFPLMKGLSESLAGRAAIFNLPGISLQEYPATGQDILPYRRILKGGFPDVLIHDTEERFFFPSYIQTYLERDIRVIQNIGDLTLFQNFLRLLALRIGNILNMTSIANDLGIGASSCKRWLSLLENSGSIYLLRPWYRNIGKRLIKSPKLYFTDTGLASYLLRIQNPEMLGDSHFSGALFENFIIIELLKLKQNLSANFDIWFYRDTNGVELDFLLETAEGLRGGEIKCSRSLSKSHLKNMDTIFESLQLKDGTVVSLIENVIPLKPGIRNLPWNKIAEIFDN